MARNIFTRKSFVHLKFISTVHCSTKIEIPMVSFNNGKRFPIMGLGTWKSKPSEVIDAVKYAIDIGYRHIDCAFIYQNEIQVGTAISDYISQKKIKREDMYITSKLWNTFHRPDLVKKALQKTLANLRLDYLDLYLIHWPFAWKENDELFPKGPDNMLLFSNVDYVDTWKEMEKVCKEGLTLSIGVSNFNEKQIERVLQKAKVLPVTNQIELHPYLTQKDLVNFCKSKGVLLTAYSPLGSPDRPTYSIGEPELMKNKLLKQLTEKIGKTPAQILLRYQVQQGNIVIPKSVTKSRIKENIEIFDFELSEADIALLDAFNINQRYCAVPECKKHKDYPF